MGLKGFDGRLFAIYLEPLPRSLVRLNDFLFIASDARTVLEDMSSALDYLCEQRVVHNDIKPANIAYSPQRGAVLLDFGLAGEADVQAGEGGSPWYVPPEFAADASARGAPGVVWALGVTM